MESINSYVFRHRNAIFRDTPHSPNQVPIALTVIFKILMMTVRVIGTWFGVRDMFPLF
jgi:hypothetical protein